jgi:hypothetical protein
MATRNLFTVIALSMVFFSGAMIGCASLSARSPFKELGIQLKAFQAKTSKGVEIPDQPKKDVAITDQTKKDAAISDQTKREHLDLEQAKTDLELARQKVELAELKMELSVLEMRLADYHQKMAETELSKVKIFEQRQKLEANHKLGKIKKATDIEKLKALKTKSLDLESENIQTKAAIAKIDMDIQVLKQKVDLHNEYRASADY